MSADDPDPDHASDDDATSGLGRTALVNSAKLTAALLTSWVLALIGRFLLPIVLGRERFGELAFIESIAVLVLSIIGFGITGYVRKEVSADPAIANEFSTPVRHLQFGSGFLLAIALAGAFLATSGLELGMVALGFGLAQLSIVLGQMDAAYLHAKHEATAVSISTIATKLLWFLLLLAMIGAGQKMLALPLALLASETVRAVWLRRAVRTSFGPAPSTPLANALLVAKRSTPYFVNTMNIVLMEYSVRILVGALGSRSAVALLTTAILVSSVPMLLTPVLSWVAVPIFTTLRKEGETNLWMRVSQMIDLMSVTICAGAVGLFAVSDDLMPILFGDEFTGAGPAFALLALTVPATYFTQTIGSAFIADDRTWQNTRVNLYTMVLVIVGVVIVLVVDVNADDTRMAWLAAAVITFGEWVTVITLILLRPFPRPQTSTLVRLAIVAGVLVLAVYEKATGSSAILHIVIVMAAVVIAISDVPRLIYHGREMLRPSSSSIDPSRPA